MWTQDEAPPIDKPGVLAAAGAAGVVLAGWMRLMSGVPGWPVIVAIGLAAGAMIIVLCRATMPASLRTPLVLALLATMMFGAARADMFGMRGVTDTVAQGVDQAAASRDAIDRYASGNPDVPVAGTRGAQVVLVAGRGGGSEWAREINGTWSGRIGGHAAQGLRITGSVDEDDRRDGIAWVAIDWAISRDFESARCGRTSAGGRDRATIVQAIGEPMAQAVARSISLGKVSCP